jgi:hypothetical protein
MRTIFDSAIQKELIDRITALDVKSEVRWGRMNLYQMLGHCITWDEWVLGKNNPVYKQAFIGLLFGKIALRSLTKNDKPLSRNIPSSNHLIMMDKEGNVEHSKKRWITLIKDYSCFSNSNFIHDFFGRMTTEQIGILAYKHADHHLRQFSC